MKIKLLIFIAVLIAIVAGWYLISPIFNEVQLDEASPLEFKDSLDSMDSKTKENFDLAVDSAKDIVIQEDESMDKKSSILSEAEFKERAHEVEGKALLINANGQNILRFEDFQTINGPNLHIYLSSDLGDEDFIDLGEIKATKGNVNYEIPEEVDLEKYNKVLVWCVPFKVLFSYADLS